ncbi:hypothetical protein HUJ04_007100 [Dendroctonus ponderosae]|nr:hypothetical protein HUJ04_007100 [Dendroctonus ponderosae]
MVLMGDLNCHHLLWDKTTPNKGGKTLQDFLFNNELILLNDGTPTLLQNPNHGKSALDLTIVSGDLATFSNWRVLPDYGGSDHFPTSLRIGDSDHNFDDIWMQPYKVRPFYEANWDLYYEKLNLETFPNDITFLQFESKLNNIADQTIPFKTLNKPSKEGNGGTQSAQL